MTEALAWKEGGRTPTKKTDAALTFKLGLGVFTSLLALHAKEITPMFLHSSELFKLTPLDVGAGGVGGDANGSGGNGSGGRWPG